LRPVAVEVISEDKPGILAALSKCFLEHSVNIAQAKCRTTEDNRGLNTFQVTVSHVDQLNKVLRTIQGSMASSPLLGFRRLLWLKSAFFI
jgi:guanosine-3',5'-bis(diphosphate) 3'-pyrophosphohydrolase